MSEWKETGFGKIPKEWNVVKFSDALKIKGRIGWKGYKTSDLRDYGPVVIGGVNIKSNIYLDYSTLTHLSQEKYEESPEIMLKKGDIILVTRGNGIGDVGRFNGEFQEATINPSVVIFSDFRGDSKFLYYFLSSPQGNDQIMSLEGGSSIPALYQGLLKTLELPFPEISTQKAIAAVLSSLDDKIDLLHRQNKTLEALAETLFRQWFIEEAQDDWVENKISDIAEHIKVNIKPSSSPTAIFHHYSIPAFDDGKMPKLEFGSEILSNKYEVFPNTIMVSKLNPRFPRIWAIGDQIGSNSICSTEFQVFKPKKEVSYSFLYFLFKSAEAKAEMEMAASGTSGSHQRVKPDDMLNISFAVPAIEKVEEFSKNTLPLLLKREKNKSQIIILEKLRDTLLPKLMSGEVRVKMSEPQMGTD